MSQVVSYVLNHRTGPPAPGLVVLSDDFGASAPPPPEEDTVDLAAIDARVAAIRDTVRAVQAARPTGSLTKAQILARIEEVWTHQLGPFDDLAREIGELAHAPK